jgi:DNA repair protein RadC
MPITDWPIEERPRERLLTEGPHVLSEAELLAIFLRTGVKGKTAVDLARDLLTEYKGLRYLMQASRQRFCQSKGLGSAKYAQLQAVLEMNKRHLRETLREKCTIQYSQEMKQYLIAKLRHQQREIFACMFLDVRNRILHYEEIFLGTIDCAHIYPREVVKCAMEHNAAAVILAHNHPSGIAEPSDEDKKITTRLVAALELVNVRVLDHIIVGENVVSFAELGLM